MKEWLEHGNFISRFLVQFHLISNFYEAIENPDAECFRPMAGLTVDGAGTVGTVAAGGQVSNFGTISATTGTMTIRTAIGISAS